MKTEKEQKETKFKKPTCFRLTKQCNDIIWAMMDRYPEDYKTKSDVVRAGVFALKRWKEERAK